MDSFTVQWINRLEQFGAVEMDMIITHDQGEIDEQRINKRFKTLTPEAIDANFLAEVAEDEIERIVKEYEAQNI